MDVDADVDARIGPGRPEASCTSVLKSVAGAAAAADDCSVLTGPHWIGGPDPIEAAVVQMTSIPGWPGSWPRHHGWGQ